MKKILWVLLDSRMGSVGQARGVVSFLDKEKYEIVEKNLEYTKLSGLPNFLRGKTLVGLTPECKKQIIAPFPDMVLSISRRTVPVARYIKKQNKNTKLIQLMHPGKTGLKEFDLALVPEHDKNKKAYSNIAYVVGAPHRITDKVLEDAKKKWEPEFANLPKPLTAVIVGGAIKKKEFSLENAADLGNKVRMIKEKTGGSILITTSRRTGEKAQNAIMEALKGIPAHTFLWGEKKENPYMGYLACADNIVVTGDSVSMCCESCGTNKPVFVFTGKKWLTRKHIRFVASLYKNGYAVALKERNLDFKPKKALNAAVDAAKQIEKL
ncbi:MAG: nucleoside-diphosphate sugar epimerase [Alphaproteobacteria bacterium]|nr:nucleoside-diphosphate sugar epimerase [Alphaproteobacteria bacterium]